MGYVGLETLERIAAVVNRLLNRANLELRQRGKTIPSLMSHMRLDTAGKTVEFIGTQGIGKSKFNNDLHKFLEGNWFFRADLCQVGPISDTVSMAEVEELHRDIYFRKLRHLEKKQTDPWKSITTARQMSKVISESLTVLSNDFPRGFFLDEGLFKNFPREVLKLGSESAEPLWTNRALIYLRAHEPEFVVSRYRGRVAERSLRGLPQRPPSDNEVRERIVYDNDLFDRIVDQARAFDCPVIVIYAEDNYQESIGKVLDFERKLRTEVWPNSRRYLPQI